MILGRILSMVGKEPLDMLLRRKVLEPMGLTSTASTADLRHPQPGAALVQLRAGEVPAHPARSRSFYEEATFWNTLWGTPDGGNETTTIADLATTAARLAPGRCCPGPVTAR